MTDAVLVAIIGLAGTVIGALTGFSHKSRQESIKDAEREQKQADQHQQLLEKLNGVEKRLDEHNGYAQKFAESSKHLAIIDERQAAQSKQIEHLQKDIDFLKSDRCKV